MHHFFSSFFFFFFNDTATTEIYTLSLHDALPICRGKPQAPRAIRNRQLASPTVCGDGRARPAAHDRLHTRSDRKSTRLNSSHQIISYAVFCLKKKKKTKITYTTITYILSATSADM